MNLFRVWVPFVLTAAAACAQPAVTSVVNNASGILQGLPNAGIAQGSIFLVGGTGLGPANVDVSTNPFQTTTMDDVTVAVTPSGGTAVNVPLYYVSASQISALLPSNTAAGNATLTVTYQGQTSTSASFVVVQNNLGMFTLGQNGVGAAVVTYADYSLVSAVKPSGALGAGGPNTYGGAANPGDTLILWATGLGPVSGNELGRSGLGTDMPSIPLMLWIGGVQATVTYRGRSGCCIGEDQIVFVVPNNVPTGCAVPFVAQIGSLVSNTGFLPVAASGRTCTPANPLFSSNAVQSAGNGTVSVGQLQLSRQAAITNNGLVYQDVGQGQFASITTDPLYAPVLPSYLDSVPMGTCTVFTSLTPSVAAPTAAFAGLDAGKITVSGPNGAVAMLEKQTGGQPTQYTATFSQSGTYFSGGNYTVSAAGGSGLGAFSSGFAITSAPVWPSSNQFQLSTGVARSTGMTINWTGGSANYYIEIDGKAGTGTANVGAGFACLVPSSALSFTVPGSVLLALPATSASEIDFRPTLNPVGVAGLDLGSVSLSYETTSFVPLQ